VASTLAGLRKKFAPRFHTSESLERRDVDPRLKVPRLSRLELLYVFDGARLERKHARYPTVSRRDGVVPGSGVEVEILFPIPSNNLSDDRAGLDGPVRMGVGGSSGGKNPRDGV
jgi:hypothetical protein